MATQEFARGKIVSYTPALVLTIFLLLGVSGCSAQSSPQSEIKDTATVETLSAAATTEEVNTPAPTMVTLPTAVNLLTGTVVAESGAISLTVEPVVTERVSETATVASMEIVTAIATEVATVAPAAVLASINNKLYTNSTYGYTVAYPETWWPSGITYANAFEIRNYDPQNPSSVPEEQRASVTIVDTVNETATVTEAHLDTLLAAEGAAEIIIDGHRAVRVQRERAGQQLGPGASQTSSMTGTVADMPRYLTISTYIANETHLVSIEASVPVEADVRVSEEIRNIENSVRFGAPN